MASNEFNDTAADLETIGAGTTLYRIRRADPSDVANSFNPKPKLMREDVLSQ